MSISDVFRRRHRESGYVYIAGSQSLRLLKIGTTKAIWNQQKSLRNKRYGGVGDWVLLYHVLVEQGGKTEHEARRSLRRVCKYYQKDGHRQKGRELVRCDYSIAVQALRRCLNDAEHASAWQSPNCDEFEFELREAETKREAEVSAFLNPPIPEVAFDPIFLKRVKDLEMSVRSSNLLTKCGVIYLGDLVEMTELLLLRSPNIGRKSLEEIKAVLERLKLRLGVRVIGWAKANPDLLTKIIGTSLLRSLDELELSPRAVKCLRRDGIMLVGDLARKTEAEMLRSPNFGRKSTSELKGALARIGLCFGMKIPGWPVSAGPS